MYIKTSANTFSVITETLKVCHFAARGGDYM